MKKKLINRGWDIKTNRCVAFLDIMGFKDLVARNTHQKIYEMLNAITQIQNIIEYSDKDSIFITKFSDSIAIFSKDSKTESVQVFMGAVGYLFANCIRMEIPIKGAISYGQISVDIDNSLFFGQPIIDAYLLEEELKYYGVILHHSAVNILDQRKLLVENFVKHIETPLKCGRIFHYNLDWFSPSNAVYNDDIKIDEYIKKFYKKISGAPRVYIDNTIAVYNSMLSRNK
ncbi:MAG: hypothetical protein J6V19_03205 [Alistipes sp.]|nr:hypothetical protein [Alistipes sp.]